MGVGNLQRALSAYGERDIPYAQLFFDSTPLRHARRLARPRRARRRLLHLPVARSARPRTS